jgi:Fic family protein
MPTLSDQLVEGPRAWARLNQFCNWLGGPEFRAEPGEEVQTAILQALGAHLFLLRLAPFRHCNDATARLAGYRLLRAAGLPAMAAHLPAAHFAATADQYAALIGEASDPGGATFAFVAYALRGIGDGLRDQIAALGTAQQANVWRDRIAELFDGRTRTGDIRRRMLAEALGRADGPVRIGRLRYLTPKLAEAYAGKSAKTLSRDVRWLEEEGLVKRTLQGVAALRDDADMKQAA